MLTTTPLVTCASGLPSPLGLIHLLEWLAELQRNVVLTRSPVYYERIECRNSQMEETHGASYVARGTELVSTPSPGVLPSRHRPELANPKVL